MLKNRKKIYIIILAIISILIIFFIFTRNNIKEEKEKEKEKEKAETVYSTELSKEQKEDVISNLKEYSEDTDNYKIDVNGERISKEEIELTKFQTNNDFRISKSQKKSEDEIIQDVIKNHVILQDAKKNNITLTQTESEEIEKNIDEYTNQNIQETKDIANALNMDYDTFIEFYKTRRKNLEIISKWKVNLANLINEEKIQIDDSEFNNKYKSYKNATDNKQRSSLLVELVEVYENYILKKAEIKYVQ